MGLHGCPVAVDALGELCLPTWRFPQPCKLNLSSVWSLVRRHPLHGSDKTVVKISSAVPARSLPVRIQEAKRACRKKSGLESPPIANRERGAGQTATREELAQNHLVLERRLRHRECKVCVAFEHTGTVPADARRIGRGPPGRTRQVPLRGIASPAVQAHRLGNPS